MRSTTPRIDAARRLAAVVGVTWVTALPMACALSEDGQPWGRVDPSLEASFSPDTGRLTPEGWLRTSTDYAIELTRLDVEIGELSATLATSGEELSFDPAAPPPGYTNCHNGHCHADDGTLPTYAEIEAELAGGGDAAAPASLLIEVDTRVGLTDSVQAVALGACGGCALLERGELRQAAMHLHGVAFEARVHDLRTGTDARLPAEGLAVTGDIELDIELTVPIDVEFDRDAPLGARLTWALALTPALFDRVDWAGLTASPDGTALDVSTRSAVVDALELSLIEHNSLDLHVERYD